MPRVLSHFGRLAFLSYSIVVGAGCVLHGDPLCPQNQAWCCQDDPRIGACEFGCGWVNPWDDLCGEVVIVGETGCHGCHPCARAIACDLDNQGVESRIIGKHEVNLAARDIFAGLHSGCWNGPVVIVGCRAGVDDAIRLCRILETVGVGVDKLILVGNSCCTFAPCNIASCVNLYYSDGGLAGCSGQPLCAEGNGAPVANLDLSICGDEARFCSCSDYARELAVQQVLASASQN